MAGKRLAYWDACIWLAWIKDETRPDPADMDGVAYLVEQWDAGSLVVATSTITRVEVLESTLTDEQAALFRSALRRSTVRVEGVTSAIADVAHTLRDYYRSPRLATPDAIHLATAIAAGCDRFYTFDGAKPDTKILKLLPLGPTLAEKYSLSTVLPRRPGGSQLSFPTPPRREED